jgi:hypothetical protein
MPNNFLAVRISSLLFEICEAHANKDRVQFSTIIIIQQKTIQQ